MFGFEHHKSEYSHQRDNDCEQGEEGDETGEVGLGLVLALKFPVKELNVNGIRTDGRVNLRNQRGNLLHDGRDVGVLPGAHQKRGERPPRVLSEYVQGQRRHLIFQRGEIEVAAETDHLRISIIHVAQHFFIQAEAELAFSRLIEYEHPVLALLVGLSEIAAFLNGDSHKLEEVPSDRVALKAYLLALVQSAPAHTGRLHKVSVSPADILDLRVLQKFGTNSLGRAGHITVDIRDEQPLPIEAHIVTEHKLPLKPHEHSADYQRDGYQKLQSHKQIPEHAALGA